MTDSFQSPLRLTDPAAAVGKTVARVKGGNDHDYLFLEFTDGTFLYIEADGYDDGAGIELSGAIDKSEAYSLDLIDRDLYETSVRERNAAFAAEQDAAERATFERLKAKFGEAK